MLCEDFPCCGHVLNECPTGPEKRCPDCGRSFMPCSLGEIYCLACGQTPRAPKFEMGEMLIDAPKAGDSLTRVDKQKVGICVECECWAWDGQPQPLFWARYGKRHDNLCHDCADAYGQAASDDEHDRRYGDR